MGIVLGLTDVVEWGMVFAFFMEVLVMGVERVQDVESRMQQETKGRRRAASGSGDERMGLMYLPGGKYAVFRCAAEVPLAEVLKLATEQLKTTHPNHFVLPPGVTVEVY